MLPRENVTGLGWRVLPLPLVLCPLGLLTLSGLVWSWGCQGSSSMGSQPRMGGEQWENGGAISMAAAFLFLMSQSLGYSILVTVSAEL